MNDYICYRFHCEPLQPLAEILISELADLAFESFVEKEDGFEAFLPAAEDCEAMVAKLLTRYKELGSVTFGKTYVPGQNWNAVWESDYQNVRVRDRCLVRAPFHPAEPHMETEVVIAPQMSFGTGHHATTYLMLDYLLDVDLQAMDVLDMGCGTGVLAIAALLRGAASAFAVDIEPHAVDNTLYNAALNGVQPLVEKGAVELLKSKSFHLIFANINKNVLRADMSMYVASMQSGGILLLSGFFVDDVNELRQHAEACGLIFAERRNKDEWAALKLTKP